MVDVIFRIPLENVPQRFNITLAGRDLVLVCRWNQAAEIWIIDLEDALTSAILLSALPLVAGVDILGQYQHLGLGGALVVYTDADPLAPPTLDNLGGESNLYFVGDDA